MYKKVSLINTFHLSDKKHWELKSADKLVFRYRRHDCTRSEYLHSNVLLL